MTPKRSNLHDRHTNRERYFKEQIYTTEKYVIPFISETKPVTSETSILEIGCGEGGNLTPFLDMGCKVTGIDLSTSKIDKAKAYFEDHPQKQNLTLVAEDIYNTPDLGKYDVIMMRDVIEHIHNQEKFMAYAKRFLADDGVFYLGFPPWYNPFGGHQQMCQNKYLSKLPWIHLLPRFMYKDLMRLGGEKDIKIRNLMEIRDTGISIERFERILEREDYHIEQRTHYLFNPNYEIKFKLTPRKQIPPFTYVPFLRNFVITASYYLLSHPDA